MKKFLKILLIVLGAGVVFAIARVYGFMRKWGILVLGIFLTYKHWDKIQPILMAVGQTYLDHPFYCSWGLITLVIVGWFILGTDHSEYNFEKLGQIWFACMVCATLFMVGFGLIRSIGECASSTGCGSTKVAISNVDNKSICYDQKGEEVLCNP